jgi:histidine ammonia-lyase
MLVQYTAASLVSESKTLAHPASVDSIPSSAGQEDHVSMGMTSARHARDCVEIAEQVVAMEALCAAQALDLRSPLAPGVSSAASLALIREAVPFLSEDRELGPNIAAVTAMVRNGALAARSR